MRRDGLDFHGKILQNFDFANNNLIDFLEFLIRNPINLFVFFFLNKDHNNKITNGKLPNLNQLRTLEKKEMEMGKEWVSLLDFWIKKKNNKKQKTKNKF